MKKISLKTFFIVFILTLSSCSVYKSSFDCPHKKGIGCESVSRVNDLINDDGLDEFVENLESKKKNKSCNCHSARKVSLDQTKTGDKEELNQDKITIHFNEYKERGITHKESQIEVDVK